MTGYAGERGSEMAIVRGEPQGTFVELVLWVQKDATHREMRTYYRPGQFSPPWEVLLLIHGGVIGRYGIQDFHGRGATLAEAALEALMSTGEDRR